MATLSLTIPDVKVPAVIAAIEHTGFERIKDEGDRVYAIRYLVWHLKERDYVCRQDTAGSGIVPDEDLIGEAP